MEPSVDDDVAMPASSPRVPSDLAARLERALAELRQATAAPPGQPNAPVEWADVPPRWRAALREMHCGLSPAGLLTVLREEWVRIVDAIEIRCRKAACLASLLPRVEHGPDPGELDAAPALAKWATVLVDSSVLVLAGHVSGHPTLGPGMCKTPQLLGIDPARRWAATQGQWFRLGEPMQRRDLIAYWGSGVNGIIVDVDEARVWWQRALISQQVTQTLAFLDDEDREDGM